MKKKLTLLLSLVLCLIFVVGCKSSSKEENLELTDETKQLVITNMDQNFDMWKEFDFASVYENPSVDKDTQNEYKAWGKLRDSLGEFESKTEVEVGELTFDNETNQYTVTAKMFGQFKNGKIKFTMTFDQNGTFVTDSLRVQEEQTKSQIMSKAGMNTLMGMGTVFIVLILISLVISCLGMIGKSQAKKAAQAKANQEATPAPAAMAPVFEESIDVTDDLELVAVITAAIMASMGDEAPAEGLVVRSIKKRNVSKWKNA